MTTRRDFLAGASALGLVAGCGTVGVEAVGRKDYSYDPGRGICLAWPELASPVRIRMLTDTHLALVDARDAEHADHYKRMKQWPGNPQLFRKALAAAQAEKPDLLLLTGDNISFPTRANVEFLHAALESCGIPYLYVAGNHDWHFEGDAGSDLEQRERWIAARLTPLYQGTNPLMTSRVVKGVRVVAIDNSVYHVLPEQVDFWRAEAAKGDPIVLAMHIPFWQPGWSVTTCACPMWGAATDPYWQTERRERWAARLNPATFAFREAVMATPNLVAVLAGHVHHFQAARDHGQNLFTAPANSRGEVLNVSIGA